MLERFLAHLLNALTHVIVGSRAFFEVPPTVGRRVYYGNHSSHGDFVLIWSALPAAVRARTRPVAAADYWQRGRIRRYVIHRVFNGVLIDRHATERLTNPIATMAEAIDSGAALILFPEGTRNTGDDVLPFKSGLYHLARRCDDVELVPVWLDNLKRAMPKGRFIPLPLLCTATFGTPIRLEPGEGKRDFLERARNVLLALAPEVNAP